jgi:hypothetical protein
MDIITGGVPVKRTCPTGEIAPVGQFKACEERDFPAKKLPLKEIFTEVQ